MYVYIYVYIYMYVVKMSHVNIFQHVCENMLTSRGDDMTHTIQHEQPCVVRTAMMRRHHREDYSNITDAILQIYTCISYADVLCMPMRVITKRCACRHQNRIYYTDVIWQRTKND